jgi:hypothetical protein
MDILERLREVAKCYDDFQLLKWLQDNEKELKSLGLLKPKPEDD